MRVSAALHADVCTTWMTVAQTVSDTRRLPQHTLAQRTLFSRSLPLWAPDSPAEEGPPLPGAVRDRLR